VFVRIFPFFFLWHIRNISFISFFNCVAMTVDKLLDKKIVLLNILQYLHRKEKEMRLLLVGLDNAGKSTILSRINGEEIDSVAPTLGFNIKTFNYADYVLNV